MGRRGIVAQLQAANERLRREMIQMNLRAHRQTMNAQTSPPAQQSFNNLAIVPVLTLPDLEMSEVSSFPNRTLVKRELMDTNEVQRELMGLVSPAAKKEPPTPKMIRKTFVSVGTQTDLDPVQILIGMKRAGERRKMS